MNNIYVLPRPLKSKVHIEVTKELLLYSSNIRFIKEGICVFLPMQDGRIKYYMAFSSITPPTPSLSYLVYPSQRKEVSPGLCD